MICGASFFIKIKNNHWHGLISEMDCGKLFTDVSYLLMKSKEAMLMSALQVEALQYVKYIPEMTDDKLRILIDTFQKLVAPAESTQQESEALPQKKRKLGSMEGLKFIADGHDLDECNDEVARMFGVADE